MKTEKYKILYESSNCKIIEADIFEVFEDMEKVIMGHDCNAFLTFGSGIARIIREKYPQAYEADCKTFKGDRGKLGSYSFAKIKEGKIIANLYTQYSFTRNSLGDRDTSYDAAYDAFKSLFSNLKDKSYTILTPYGICSNLAKARWPIILKMIEVMAEDYNIDVVICKLAQQEELK